MALLSFPCLLAVLLLCAYVQEQAQVLSNLSSCEKALLAALRAFSVVSMVDEMLMATDIAAITEPVIQNAQTTRIVSELAEAGSIFQKARQTSAVDFLKWRCVSKTPSTDFLGDGIMRTTGRRRL